MNGVEATIHGAISIVNAIATGKGATLGISSKVKTVVGTSPGSGIQIQHENQNISSRLINRVVEDTVPKRILQKNKITVQIESEIPTGYGLKSSSAISSVVSLACHRLFKKQYTDRQVLLAGVNASIATKVSMTGAYDDACACYFGGTVVTDNLARKIISLEKSPTDISVLIFVPRSRKRGNIKHLRNLKETFGRAWDFAKGGDYWNAMILNGLAAASILNSDPKIVLRLIEEGALAASVSGNGPAIAAVAKKEKITNVRKILSELEGEIIASEINNKKAYVHEL